MISEQQLLYLIRSTVNQATATESEIERQQLLGSANLLINELLLRNQPDFYLKYYAGGLDLFSEGIGLARTLALNTEVLEAALSELPKITTATTTADFLLESIDRLWSLQSDLVAILPTTDNSKIQDFLERLNQWEVSAYAYRETMAPDPEMELIEEATYSKEAFAEYLKHKKPEWNNLQVRDFFQIGGGFSKVTLLMDLEDDLNGKHSLAVRAQPAVNTLDLLTVDVENEFPVVQLAFNKGVTVAEPLWLENDTQHFGAKFIVSRRAPGANLGDATGATQEITAPMVASLAEESAKIHAINLHEEQDGLKNSVLEDWCALNTVEEATQKNIEFWRQLVEKAGIAPSPTVERGFRWLEDNIEPCQDRPSLLHGDIGLHNVLIENEKVTAVLDWEVVTVGDPAQDLSWTLQCTDKYVTSEQLLDYYHKAGGKPVSEYRLRYHDVFMCIRMPIAALGMAKSLEKRLDSPQYAVFALRFMHHNSSRLANAIKAAEAVRNW